MKKRVLAAALALTLALGLLPMSVLAASWQVDGRDVNIEILGAKEIEIDGQRYYTLDEVPTNPSDRDTFRYYDLSGQTVTVTWSAGTLEEKVTVTFNVNAPAGADAPAAPAAQEIDKGGVLNTVPTLTLEGYTLAGWAETAGGEVITGLAAKTFDADTELFAVWEKNKTPAAKAAITVKNTAEEADKGMVLEITLSGNTFAAPEKPADFTRPAGAAEEAVFVGWSQSLNDGSTSFVKVGDTLVYDENLILVAVWAAPVVDVDEDLKKEVNGNKVITGEVLEDKVAAAVETAGRGEPATVTITVTASTKITVNAGAVEILKSSSAALELTTANGAAVVVNAEMAKELVGKTLPVPVTVPVPASAQGAADKLGGSRLTPAILSGIRSITEFHTGGLFSAPKSVSTTITIPVTVGRDNFVLVHLGTMARIPASAYSFFTANGKTFARCTVNHFSCYAEADGSIPAIQALDEEGAEQPPVGNDVANLTLVETSDKSGYTIDLSGIDGARYIVYQTSKGKIHAINWNELSGEQSTTVGKGNGDSVKVWILSAAPAFKADGTFADGNLENLLATNKDA